ncbi:DUF3330 domain-containing protein [Ramlibacter sp.]|uniref:DUF3330 domain-containing protein n=1 Tax=Ramlibacter sp. TaxID=1917967 RepID=UPI002D801DCC|nr:DUF3330 domain-containing protein [Ramlibacter sp.]
MTGATTSTEQDLVSCEMCFREVPRSEAAVPEATDYVLYFCGLQCYQKWKEQQPGAAEPPAIAHQ